MGKFVMIDGFQSAGDFSLVDTNDISHGDEKLNDILDEHEQNISKAKTDIKSNADEITELKTKSADYAKKSEVYTKSEVYSKAETNTELAKHPLKTEVYTKSETDAELAKKVNTQSGYGLISDADKAQIAANKAAAESLREDLTATQSEVASKASSESVSTLQTEMAVQEARMDQLVGEVPEGSADEIADARVDETGKTWPNLGDHIRGSASRLKEHLESDVGTWKYKQTKKERVIQIPVSAVVGEKIYFNPLVWTGGSYEYIAIFGFDNEEYVGGKTVAKVYNLNSPIVITLEESFVRFGVYFGTADIPATDTTIEVIFGKLTNDTMLSAVAAESFGVSDKFDNVEKQFNEVKNQIGTWRYTQTATERFIPIPVSAAEEDKIYVNPLAWTGGEYRYIAIFGFKGDKYVDGKSIIRITDIGKPVVITLTESFSRFGVYYATEEVPTEEVTIDVMFGKLETGSSMISAIALEALSNSSNGDVYSFVDKSRVLWFPFSVEKGNKVYVEPIEWTGERYSRINLLGYNEGDTGNTTITLGLHINNSTVLEMRQHFDKIGIYFATESAPVEDVLIVARAKILDSSSVLAKIKEISADIPYTMYTKFSALGLNYSTATPVDVCKAMPNRSIFIIDLDNTSNGFVPSIPSKFGMCLFIKRADFRCTCYRWECANNKTDVYIANYWSDDEGKTYSFTGFEPMNAKGTYQIRNNPIFAKQLVDCAESYLTDRCGITFDYSSGMTADDNVESVSHPFLEAYHNKDQAYYEEHNHNFYPENPPMDCQSLVKSAINGIPYSFSQYANKNYRYRDNKIFSWAVDLRTWLVHEFAYWCCANGYEISAGINYKNLQAGDLIFFSSHPAKGVTQWRERMSEFRHVDHVAMYTGRWVPDPNRNNELHPETIEVKLFETPNKDVVLHRFVDEVSDGEHITSHSVEWICMYARIPLAERHYWTNANTNENPVNIMYSSESDTGYRIEITGNGSPVTLWIGSQNGVNGLEIGSINTSNGEPTTNDTRIRTGFIPCKSSTALNNISIPTGYKRVGANRYRSDLSYTTKWDDCAFVKLTFGKTDDSRITESDLEIMKDCKFNGSNIYPFEDKQENPVLITGNLAEGEKAIIETRNGYVTTDDNGTINILGNTSKHIGFKQIYAATSQEMLVTFQ